MLKTFILALPFFVAFDVLWVGIIAKKLYLNSLRPFLRLAPDGTLAPVIFPTICIYFLLALGVTMFSIPLANGIPLRGFFYGALFGLVVYGVYEFTNWSLVANWPVKIVIIDTLWGMLLCGLVSMIVIYLQKTF